MLNFRDDPFVLSLDFLGCPLCGDTGSLGWPPLWCHLIFEMVPFVVSLDF